MRGHSTLEPALLEATFSELQQHINTSVLITDAHIYSIVVEYALNPFESGGGFPKAILRYWMEVDDVLQNAGNPLFTRNSRLGFHMATPYKLNYRPGGAGIYMWRGAGQMAGVAANNITGLPTGAKGCRLFVFKSCHLQAGTYSGIVVSPAEIFAYLRRVE